MLSPIPSGSRPQAPPRHESLPPPPLQPLPQRPPIRIIVMCDGTAQQRNWVKTSIDKNAPAAQSGDFFTNVALLAKAINTAAVPSTDDADSSVIPQLVFYQSGVGTTSSLITNIVERGTGLSLGGKIEEAYSFVCDNYQPGDELFFFGFSRGAYTARCISGMINWCGVLSKIEMTHFADIWGAYQRRDPEKIETDDEAAEVLFQATGRYPSLESEATATNMFTYNLDHDDTLTPQQRASMLQQRQQRCDRRKNKIKPPEIKVVGVWDTVRALGVPGLFQDNAMVDFFNFYDPGLGSNVQYAFHALSIEEDRKDFLPTLWYKPQPLTMQTQSSTRNSTSARSERQEEELHEGHRQVLKQCWFQGVHSDLGGGYQYHGLSDVSLIWMVSQLVDPHKQPGGRTSCGNLLSIDLDLLRSVLDQRRLWGCQIPHRSRPTLNFQHNRIVHQRRFDPSTMKRTVWANMSLGSRTYESIHPSVVVGGRIGPSHKSFAELREDDPDKFEEMWSKAKDFANTMRPTELLLHWDRPGPYPSPTIDPRNPQNPQQGGWNIPLPRENPYASNLLLASSKAQQSEDLQEPASALQIRFIPSQELGENPVDKESHPTFEKVWKAMYDAAAWPNLAIANVLNLRIVPRANLNTTALQNFWWKMGNKYMGYSAQYKDMYQGYTATTPDRMT